MIVDKVGRRRPFILGAIGCGLCMMIASILLSQRGTSGGAAVSGAAIAFFYLVSPAHCTLFLSSSPPPSAPNSRSNSLPSGLTIYPYQFMFCYTMSCGTLAWGYVAEVLPLHARSMGAAIAAAVAWRLVSLLFVSFLSFRLSMLTHSQRTLSSP